jgi:hypothetical protein
MLGRLPHDPDRPTLKLGRYLATEAVVPHPAGADYLALVNDWGLYGNDKFGDCGPVSVANQRKQVTHYLAGTEQSPSLDDVFNLYRASGNPSFDPATGADDNGVVMADMLSALLKTGIGGTRPLAYASVDVAKPEEVRAAIGLFGSVLFGVELDVAQQAQTDKHQPWDYVRRSAAWGGHAILAGAYTGDASHGAVDVSVVSWGERIGVTDAFCARQLAEAWVVIWPELLGTEEFDKGLDISALAADYQQLTGRPFPSLPTPVPPAPPAPSDAAFRAKVAEFVAEAQAWLGGHP